MKLIRVFPIRTSATPDDENVRINTFPSLFDEADEVHISVTFTWHKKRAEQLYNQWKHVANTKIGGVAYGDKGDNFTPGLYLKKGITITSRGCNNHCWFCNVWRNEGKLRELPIYDGFKVYDNNLFSCSDQHILNVFEMLKKQKHIEFTGGVESKVLKQWHVNLLASVKLHSLFCAYDTPDDLEPLIEAGKMLTNSGISYKNMKARCYVLCGYPKDTIESAEKRIQQTVRAGFFPFAMLWRDNDGKYDRSWSAFQRKYTRPAISRAYCNKYLNKSYDC